MGSVIGLTDAGDPDATPTPIAAKLVERYDYDPYGHTYIESWDASAGGGSGAFVRQSEPLSAYGNPFMWTAQRYDTGVGLYSFPARSYSPRLGRWLQRDPLGFVDGVNMYQYCMSMPTTFTDPMGLTPIGVGVGDIGVNGSEGADPPEEGVDPPGGDTEPPDLDDDELVLDGDGIGHDYNEEIEQIMWLSLWESMLEAWLLDGRYWPPFLQWQFRAALRKMNGDLESAQEAVSRFMKFRLLWRQQYTGIIIPDDLYTSWWAANLARKYFWNVFLTDHRLYSMNDFEMVVWACSGAGLGGGAGYYYPGH